MSMKTVGLCVVLALPLLFGCTKKKVASPKQSQGVSDNGEVEDELNPEDVGRGKEYRFSGITLKLKGKPLPKQPDSATSKYPPKKVEPKKNKATDGKTEPKLPTKGQLVQ
ncbi:MAG: hypothetical protein P1V97_06120 [Planctomycetota bacterium]|nr:hypothetical protein [Planctomycetota bacterium]